MKQSMKRLLSSLSILGILLVSCGATKSDAGIPAGTAAVGITWEVLLQDNTAGPEAPQIIVAKEPDIVNDFFAKVNSASGSHFAVPKVDYSKEMLMILCMGQKNSGGYQIAIKNIEENTLSWVVTVQEMEPAPGDMALTMITKPFYVAKLKTTHKKIVFKKE